MAKKTFDIFSIIAFIFLVFGRFSISFFLGLFNLDISNNFYRFLEVAYLVFVAIFMVYMLFYLGLRQEGNKLGFSKERFKKKIFTVIAMEMFIFMIGFINYAIYHPESAVNFPLGWIYLIYIGIMIACTLIGHLRQE